MSTKTKYINVSGSVTLIFTLDVELYGEYDSEEECEAMLEKQAFHDLRMGAFPFPDESKIENVKFEEVQEESGDQDE
jgi:hypothetical protein